jgi:hypothetical protein
MTKKDKKPVATRPYEVVDVKTGDTRLVEAPLQSVALRHVVDARYTVKPASARRVGELMSMGTAYEVAGDDAEAAEALPPVITNDGGVSFNPVTNTEPGPQ